MCISQLFRKHRCYVPFRSETKSVEVEIRTESEEPAPEIAEAIEKARRCQGCNCDGSGVLGKKFQDFVQRDVLLSKLK